MSESVSTSQTSIAAATYQELGLILLGEQPVTDVMTRIAGLATKIIPGADDVSVTLIRQGRPGTVAFSPNSRVAETLDERQYENGFGPCIDAAATAQIVAVPDTSHDETYPDFAALAHAEGVRRTLAVGMPTLQETSGALNIYSYGTTGTFDAQALESASAFVAYAAVALYNSAIYTGAVEEVAQMQAALASRASIEQAKGILMRDRSCTPDQAFDILVKLSNDSNRKLREVAEVIVRSVTERT